MTIAPYMCPCCRQPAPRPDIAAKVRELPLMQGALLRVLLSDAGNFIPSDRIIRSVWCGTDGGPSNGASSLSLLMKQLQRSLRGHGWRVENKPWVGYRLVRHD